VPGMPEQVHVPHGHRHGAQSRSTAQMAPGPSHSNHWRSTSVGAEVEGRSRSWIVSDGVVGGPTSPRGPLALSARVRDSRPARWAWLRSRRRRGKNSGNQRAFFRTALAVLTFVHAEKRRKVKPKVGSEGRELNWELNLPLEAHCASVTGQPKAEATGQAAPQPADVGGALRERRPAPRSGASGVECGEDLVERDVIPSMVAYGVAVGGPGLSRSGGAFELPMNVTREPSS
jgi:hypothetical protein